MGHLRHGWLWMVMAGVLLGLAGPAGAQATQVAATTGASTVSTLGVGETKDFFTIVALPDPQNYNDKHPEVFRKQIEWIAAHAKDEHIAFATCEGDVVEHGDKVEEWEAADKSLSLLDGSVPWGVSIGNHDFDVRNDGKRPAVAFLKHFGPERFAKQAWYGGASENGLSSFQLVEASGVKLLILHLEIAAPEEAAAWAGKVLAEHPDRATVVVTHIYVSDQAKGRDGDAVAYLGKQSHSAEWVWKNLISKHPQIFLVLSGHFDNAGGQFHQTSLNEQGGSVHELLADYQNHKDGGGGYLRLMRFVPERKVMEVRTYSPVTGQFMTDKASEFVLPWEGKGAARAASQP